MFSKMTLIFMGVTIGCAVMYSFIFADEADNTAAFVAVFTMSTYMQMFSESMGRFSWEISKPYISRSRPLKNCFGPRRRPCLRIVSRRYSCLCQSALS